MSERDIFIGREQEIQFIETLLFDPDYANHLLPIIARGGIGKTFLLREISRRYRDDPRVVIVKIEFGEVSALSLPALTIDIYYQLCDYLPEEERSIYLDRLYAWEQAQQLTDLPSAPDDQVREQEEQIYQFGIELVFQLISQEKRLLFLADTLEAVKSLELADRINMLAAQFVNAVIVVVGRPEPNVIEICQRYPQIYQNWTVHPIYELEPFSTDEATRYFDEILPVKIEPDLREKICLLTNRNPILIAVAGEWLKRNFSLPEDVDLPLSQLMQLTPAELQQCREQFEFELIDRIRVLRQPIDWATLYLAYLNRRYDARILQIAMDIHDEAELQQIIAEVNTLIFVRKSMSFEGEGGLLHDEAQRLIRTHAWPMVDPDGSLRRNLAQKVIDAYYMPEIDRLKVIIKGRLAQILDYKLVAPERRTLPAMPVELMQKRTLQLECLDYAFRVSLEQGWDYLDSLFDESMNEDYSRIQMDAVAGAVYVLQPEQVNTARFKIRLAQTAFAKGETMRATALAHEALQQTGDNHDFLTAARAYMVLGDSTNDPAQQVTFYQAALDKAQQAGERAMEATILNLLGLLYRRRGVWSEAERAYKHVLRILDEQQDPTQYANTLNNLAFIYLLNGNLTRADSLAERSLRIRREQGNIRGLSFSYSTRGRIADAQGDYAEALRYHRTAYDLCLSIGDTENAALWQINIAIAERRAQDFESARTLLVPGLAQSRLDIRARALHEAAKIDVDEALLLRYREAPDADVLDKFASAETLARQGLQLARQMKDDHLVATILFDLALLTFQRDQRADTEHIAALEALLQDHHYILEKGRLMELHGDLAYVQGACLKSFEHYLSACEILHLYHPNSFRKTFSRVRGRFLDMSPDMQRQICQMIEHRFATIHPASPLMALKELCMTDSMMLDDPLD